MFTPKTCVKTHTLKWSSKWERVEYARRDVDSSRIQDDRLITDETAVSQHLAAKVPRGYLSSPH